MTRSSIEYTDRHGFTIRLTQSGVESAGWHLKGWYGSEGDVGNAQSYATIPGQRVGSALFEALCLIQEAKANSVTRVFFPAVESIINHHSHIEGLSPVDPTEGDTPERVAADFQYLTKETEAEALRNTANRVIELEEQLSAERDEWGLERATLIKQCNEVTGLMLESAGKVHRYGTRLQQALLTLQRIGHAESLPDVGEGTGGFMGQLNFMRAQAMGQLQWQNAQTEAELDRANPHTGDDSDGPTRKPDDA